jgi:hypothetical protein
MFFSSCPALVTRSIVCEGCQYDGKVTFVSTHVQHDQCQLLS